MNAKDNQKMLVSTRTRISNERNVHKSLIGHISLQVTLQRRNYNLCVLNWLLAFCGSFFIQYFCNKSGETLIPVNPKIRAIIALPREPVFLISALAYRSLVQ